MSISKPGRAGKLPGAGGCPAYPSALKRRTIGSRCDALLVSSCFPGCNVVPKQGHVYRENKRKHQ